MQKRTCSCFAQFRLGILPLHIETGRYDNTPELVNYVNQNKSKMNIISWWYVQYILSYGYSYFINLLF